MIKIHIHEANKTSRFRNLFQPKTPKSNLFSEHFFIKSHNLVVNFFNPSIDTPTYPSNQTNLPRPPYKINFLPNIPLKVTAPYLRCRQTKNLPNRTVHGHIFHTLYYYSSLSEFPEIYRIADESTNSQSTSTIRYQQRKKSSSSFFLIENSRYIEY